MANKIYTNHTLQEYKKKYGNKKNLKKIHKADIISNKSLLNGKSWWLIDDTYYEIPSNKGFKAWWSNLGKGGQIAICALLGAGVATAVVVPTVIAMNHKSTNTAVIDGDDEVKNNITVSKGETVSEGTKYTVTSKTTKEFGDLIVTMGNDTLKQVNDFTKGATNEYKINQTNDLTFNIIISKETIDAHANVEVKITIKLVVEPVVEKKINLNKTSIEVNVYGSEGIVASLSDKGTGLVTAEGKSDIVTITAKGNNTFSVTGVKEGITTITFECDGYKSATLNVTVKKAITKEKWLKALDDLAVKFNNETKEYIKSEVSLKIDGVETEFKKLQYQSESSRSCFANVEKLEGGTFTFANPSVYCSTMIESVIADDDDGHFIINSDGSIEYYCETQPVGKEYFIKSLSMNQYGYITLNDVCFIKGGTLTTFKAEVSYNGAPTHDPVVKKKINLDKKSLELTVSQQGTIEATLSEGTGTIKATASKEDVVSIDEKTSGKFTITGVSAGSATITFECDGYESATCNVTVKDPMPGVTTKEQWLAQNNALVSGFLTSVSEYSQSDLAVTTDGQPVTINTFGYGTDGSRYCYYTTEPGTGEEPATQRIIAGEQITWQSIMSMIPDENQGGHFTINPDGSTEFYCNAIPEGGNMCISHYDINKFGYLTKEGMLFDSGEGVNETVTTYTYAKDPVEPEPQELTKEEFIEASDKLLEEFINSDTVYSLDQIDTFIADGETKTPADIFYGTDADGARTCTIKYDVESEEVYSSKFIALSNLYGHNIENVIDKNNGKFILYPNGDLEYYTTEEAPAGSNTFINKIRYNKYGYIIELDMVEASHQNSFSISFNSAPQSIVTPAQPKVVSFNKESLQNLLDNSGLSIQIINVTESITEADYPKIVTITYNMREGEVIPFPCVIVSSDGQNNQDITLNFDPNSNTCSFEFDIDFNNLNNFETFSFYHEVTDVKTVNVLSESFSGVINDQLAENSGVTCTQTGLSTSNTKLHIEYYNAGDDITVYIKIANAQDLSKVYASNFQIFIKSGYNTADIDLTEIIESEAVISGTIIVALPVGQ